ncbi:hypothetical protein FB45DRAFT_930946 [Roridomyces roridus]|uniref:Uncharacterized protein n=1 Tax=Roridomyces roridus TaxID=1738132 RepID=A0AAD7BFL4_9AGAR|nr:hypothetical protein FB45DRAFT_930946 [Roridomyces roridus]
MFDQNCQIRGQAFTWMCLFVHVLLVFHHRREDKNDFSCSWSHPVQDKRGPARLPWRCRNLTAVSSRRLYWTCYATPLIRYPSAPWPVLKYNAHVSNTSARRKMAQIFHGSPTDLQLPPHPSCFGSGNMSSVCEVPTVAMMTFLNITNSSAYLDVYCNNPPADSCAFGYCPNSDVASPAVRYSTYFTSIVSAILTLYSPEEAISSFYAQLLNIYSLVVAAIISIAGHNLTKMHSVVVLTLAASPLSLYLVFYVCREMLGRQTRLKSVFGSGQYLNRALVLLAVPLWFSVLVFTTLPTVTWEFQQAACDSVIAENHIASLFFMPFIVFFAVYPEIGAIIVASLLLMWVVAIFRLRKVIWAKNKILPIGRLWRKVVNQYPFIQFYSVIAVPSAFWMFNVEVGIRDLSPREQFEATYGQLLAIFVTIPPFISLCMLGPDLAFWFADLAWVRLLTGRHLKPYLSKRKKPGQQESVLPMEKMFKGDEDPEASREGLAGSETPPVVLGAIYT